ncbi:cysteine desulfurase family protein [Bacillus alkalicellulosilyticus]|uniref:cysteine desulfurase family protein n=1 Tax=Alkalihalobacterium alkalicellulosilyticum TaxID=1912214 RepID=UPI000995F81A|nr:cysteine desulfurase family protein [Bacillus alkalicellulosilyticus]
MNQIYLDYNASTPIAPEVKEVMLPFLQEHYGNPSALHFAGSEAKKAVEQARTQVANFIGAKPNEIVFTSGGSEANNHVLKSVFQTFSGKGNHIITSKIEHPAIINPCKYLEQQGARVTYVDVDEYGVVQLDAIENAIMRETVLISIMHSNNEVGSIQPIQEISKLAKRYNVFFHTDASQSLGKVPIDVNELGVDFLTIAGHKLYAPKGIGALFLRQGILLEPFIHGAGHEQGRRAGTENVLFTVGLGKACELAKHSSIEQHKLTEIRDYFWESLKEHYNEKVVRNGHPEKQLPNTLNVSFPGQIGQELLDKLPEIAASTGSACHSGQVTLSPVLQAMGISEHIGMGTIRFSVGRYTTKEEIDVAVQLIKERV